MFKLLDYNKFGNAKDGLASSLNGVVNTYASMTGASGQAVVTTNLSVQEGDVVYLHQSQGTGAGNQQLVQVKIVGSGNFTACENLEFTFGTGAQAVRVKQVSGGTMTGTVTCDGWDGTKGGIAIIMVRGKLINHGIFSVNGADGLNIPGNLHNTRSIGGGFRGGQVDNFNNDGYGGGEPGEDYLGFGAWGKSNNGSGRGGGTGADFNDGGAENWAAAGGAHATDGGNSSNTGEHQAYGGTHYGQSDLVKIFFGCGGGGNAGSDQAGDYKNRGACGAGILIIIAEEFDNTEGYIYHIGGGGCPSGQGKAAGSGAGGSFLGIFGKVNLGTGRVIGTGGPAQTGDQVTGGKGGDGYNRIEYFSLIEGTTSPAASTAFNINLQPTIFGGIS